MKPSNSREKENRAEKPQWISARICLKSHWGSYPKTGAKDVFCNINALHLRCANVIERMNSEQRKNPKTAALQWF